MSKLDHLKTWLSGWVERGALPGIALGIYDKEGQELFYDNYSSNDLEKAGREYNKDSIYRIYSMTKVITSVCALILVEKGLLSLDNELATYVPAFKDTKVVVGGTVDAPVLEDPKSPILIRHLMTHTAGFSYGVFGNNLADQSLKRLTPDNWQTWFSNMTNKDLTEKLAQCPLLFHPGTHFHYSLATDVLGHVIEVVSQTALDKFFDQHIFQPLGMTETSFQVPSQHAHRLVDCYEICSTSSYSLSTNSERDRLGDRVLLAGGGGLVSTMGDYAKLATCLLRQGRIDVETGHPAGDGRYLLSPTLLAQMMSDQVGRDLVDLSFETSFTESIGAGIRFGLGVSVVVDPSK
ncbi:class A beta-lactamase-related serine hydrolase, partial [archaeon]